MGLTLILGPMKSGTLFLLFAKLFFAFGKKGLFFQKEKVEGAHFCNIIFIEQKLGVF